MIQPAGNKQIGCASGQHPGDCVTIEGLAPSSPADPSGQAEGLLRPKSEELSESEDKPLKNEPAEDSQIPKEEVDWSGDDPEKAQQRQKRIQKKLKKQRKQIQRRQKRIRKKLKKQRQKQEEAKAEFQESDPLEEKPPEEKAEKNPEEEVTKTKVPRAELPKTDPSKENPPKPGLSESDPRFWSWARSSEEKVAVSLDRDRGVRFALRPRQRSSEKEIEERRAKALAPKKRSEEEEIEERKAKRRKIVAKSLLESLIAKREKERKAKEEAEKDLQESECAQGSTGSKREPEEKKEEAGKSIPKLKCAKSGTSSKEEPREKKEEEEAEESDSEGEYESFGSDPEKTIKEKSTAESTSQIRREIQTTASRPRSVPRGVRPGRHPFEKLRDLRGKEGPKYKDPVHHQPTTSERPSLIDAETGIEHRLTKAGYWLPVLGAAFRTGKARSKSAHYKQRAEKKAKAIAKREAAAAPPWQQ